ncbi:YaiI/YqxD family protein [Reinekea sp.]|uniref:YaiI/YqxD family protein n=1 Tax=Reinekea sp. TaxID=1970455 RepID=UPI003988EF98
MKIWVDADACPLPIKEIIIRAANRKKIHTTFVANHNIQVPNSPFLHTLQVSQGFDVADDEIVLRSEAGDLVMTQDIPLASELIAKGCHAINPRGERWSKENIGARLNMRDFMETMRSSGVQSGGPAPFNKRDANEFANALDRLLAKLGP